MPPKPTKHFGSRRRRVPERRRRRFIASHSAELPGFKVAGAWRFQSAACSAGSRAKGLSARPKGKGGDQTVSATLALFSLARTETQNASRSPHLDQRFLPAGATDDPIPRESPDPVVVPESDDAVGDFEDNADPPPCREHDNSPNAKGFPNHCPLCPCSPVFHMAIQPAVRAKGGFRSRADRARKWLCSSSVRAAASSAIGGSSFRNIALASAWPAVRLHPRCAQFGPSIRRPNPTPTTAEVPSSCVPSSLIGVA